MLLIFGVPAGVWAIVVPVVVGFVGAGVVHVSPRAAAVADRVEEWLS